MTNAGVPCRVEWGVGSEDTFSNSSSARTRTNALGLPNTPNTTARALTCGPNPHSLPSSQGSNDCELEFWGEGMVAWTTSDRRMGTNGWN